MVDPTTGMHYCRVTCPVCKVDFCIDNIDTIEEGNGCNCECFYCGTPLMIHKGELLEIFPKSEYGDVEIGYIDVPVNTEDNDER